MGELTEFINAVGFPIVTTVVLFIQHNKLSITIGELSNTLVLMNERINDIDKKVSE